MRHGGIRWLCMIIVVCAALFIDGCFLFKKTVQLKEPENESQSLVVGYIDMEDAPTWLGFVVMRQLRPKTEKNKLRFSISEGIFFNEFVPPGIFQFDRFGGSSGNTDYTFYFPLQGKKPMDPVIEKPGIYFVGSYKYKNVKKPVFGKGEFDLIKSEKPDEKEVLEKLLKLAGKTVWRQRIMKRLEEIKR
jgi:hypothetical protein